MEATMKAIRVQNYGGPEAMTLEDVPSPKPEEGQAVVRLEAIGVNFIDIYQRMGLYPLPLPFTPGNEGAGIVEEVGPGVMEVAPGDKVAYCGAIGSYAGYAVVPSWRLVKIPKGIDPKTAAAAMLQGMTAHYLSHDTYRLKPKDKCLLHAAAGGVGLLLVQMAKRRGAQVIATVSTQEKSGVQVVYDSIGQETFDRSLKCLAPRGTLVLYGQASGPVPPFDPQVLNARGSLFLTRPTLAHYTLNREELLSRANQVFDWVAEDLLNVRIGGTFPLAEAGEAHRKLAARETTGKILLLP
jgi:NADPH2:quinone reductase